MKYIALEDDDAAFLKSRATSASAACRLPSPTWPRIAAALDAATSAPVVKVKPLVWERQQYGWDAYIFAGRGYFAWEWAGQAYWRVDDATVGEEHPAPDIAAAKAAAEAHYQAAVRALLEE